MSIRINGWTGGESNSELPAVGDGRDTFSPPAPLTGLFYKKCHQENFKKFLSVFNLFLYVIWCIIVSDMLLIPTSSKQSDIHGMGLFAAEDIAAGTPLWRFSPGLDLEISEANFDKLTRYEQDVILFYGFRNSRTKKYYLPFDDLRFVNHAGQGSMVIDEARASTEDDVAFVLVAARDIVAGEELTLNYSDF